MTQHHNRAIPFLACILALGTFCLPVTSAHADLTANFESPAANDIVSGVAVIRGWGFDTTGGQITSIQLTIDGVSQGAVACCTARPDVQAAFPAAPINSGFGLTTNWGNFAAGPHTIRVQITSTSGTFDSGERNITVVNAGGFAFLNQLTLDLVDLFTYAELQEDGTLFVECAQARDASSGATKFVDLTYQWQQACQCLTLINSVDDEDCDL